MGLVDDDTTGRQLHGDLHRARIIRRMDTHRVAGALIRINLGNLRQGTIKVLGTIKRKYGTELFPGKGIGRSALGFLHQQDLDVRRCTAVDLRHLGNLPGGPCNNA